MEHSQSEKEEEAVAREDGKLQNDEETLGMLDIKKSIEAVLKTAEVPIKRTVTRTMKITTMDESARDSKEEYGEEDGETLKGKRWFFNPFYSS